MNDKSNFKDHFSNTSGYASFRPTYPTELAEFLVRSTYTQKKALDCGCGTGQLSALLAKYFDSVIATDASEAQIKNAKPVVNVRYKVAKAEESDLKDHSVDLITVAQAAHWFDLEKFYAEVKRISKPNAVIALITYGVLFVEGEEVEKVANNFYYNVLNSYWPPERKIVEDGYKNLPFPFKEFPAPEMNMTAEWNLDELVGYIDTWSAMREIEKVQGRDPYDKFRKDLSSVWGDPAYKRKVRWPLSLRVGFVE